ncbi:uncharacterized protein LOC119996729 [Tripterygium wilfordii]|uniref:uncharacterized protein LOC119986738 n=1 Tax=Tripterygium wilfordii TaxID=458696 RepID=UPI0018F7FDA0|nr:uncharacterized protein LOC119986738 [Tripterygium wilfordii]XP_038689745.1 uncharacterized protein LOC119988684 [Tripterygium wilfordii]XP_038699398.1 uncharacterized protein LOC119996729 [Tripterygium wilfordii]
MAEGTRLKALDDAIRRLQEASSVHESSLGSLQSALVELTQVTTDQKTFVHELTNRVTAMDGRLEQVLRLAQASLSTLSSPSAVTVSTTTGAPAPAPASPIAAPPLAAYTTASMGVFPPGSVRLDFPRFDGTNPLDWVSKAEQFFHLFQTNETQKVEIASYHFDGPAWQWFQWATSAHPFPSWSDFARAIEIRFGEDISMDFVVGLPASGGKTALLVVIDRLTKYAHFCPLPSHYTSTMVAAVFVRDIIKLHGLPRSIVTDRDPLFLSTFWQEVFKLQGTKLNMSSAYHPQTDGQTEVLNRCLEMYLRCFVQDNPAHWLKFLPWAEYSYNTAYHTASGMTPFQALYGRLPPLIQKYFPGSTTCDAVDHELITRDELLRLLKTNLQRAQLRMKNQADQHRREVQFEVGDLVFIRLQPYRQLSLRLRRDQKLGPRYFGPFPIIQKVGAVAYRLELPVSAKIHPVFHVSVLKRCVGNPEQQSIPLPLLTVPSGPVVKPIAILSQREVVRQGQLIPQVLVQWENLLQEDATWEDLALVSKQFPNLNLEDKVLTDQGSIVMRPDNTGKVLEAIAGNDDVDIPTAESKGIADIDGRRRKMVRERNRPNHLRDYV